MQIPFFRQQKYWTCGPACFRMALAAFGIKKSEAELAKLMHKPGEPGTPNRSLPETAEKLKLNYIVRRSASIPDLTWYMGLGFVVIVSYFDAIESVGHFAVVKKLGSKNIYLLDPWYGPDYVISLKDFVKNWKSGFDKDKRWFIAVKK